MKMHGLSYKKNSNLFQLEKLNRGLAGLSLYSLASGGASGVAFGGACGDIILIFTDGIRDRVSSVSPSNDYKKP
jgi:hypothetical protein